MWSSVSSWWYGDVAPSSSSNKINITGFESGSEEYFHYIHVRNQFGPVLNELKQHAQTHSLKYYAEMDRMDTKQFIARATTYVQWTSQLSDEIKSKAESPMGTDCPEKYQKYSIVVRLFDMVAQEREWVLKEHPKLANVVRDRIMEGIRNSNIPNLKSTYRAIFGNNVDEDPWIKTETN